MKLETVDYHCGGSPMRVITGGLPEIRGSCFKERMEFVHQNIDFVRKQLCWEPRGYRSMTVVMPIQHDQSLADAAVLYCAATMYLPFCGEASICFVRYLMEHGLVKCTEPETKVVIQCPPGIVTCYAEWTNGKVGNVRFHGVPAYVHSIDTDLILSTGVKVRTNIVYGGAYYAIVYEDQLQLDISKEKYTTMTSWADDVTQKAIEQSQLPMCGTIINDRSLKDPTFRFVVCGESMVNRGFCGSGSTCCATFDYFNGNLKLGESRQYGSIVTKQCATVTPVKATKIDGHDAVIIEIKSRAYRTGNHVFEFESDDPLVAGFLP